MEEIDDSSVSGSSTLRLLIDAQTFQDRHVKNSSKDPQMDSSQDYCLLQGFENKTHTVLRFSRPYDTCDRRDLKITVGGLIYTASGVKDNFAWRGQWRRAQVPAGGSFDGFTRKIEQLSVIAEPRPRRELFIAVL
ncbi:MOXD1 like protein 2 [Habropoda laboriosa]|uniref:MOXD1 like protein 2 n=1 Tax=Habropoda laboriosa TaxID=597456 RepID=A0A0L7QZK8_9HYME|nr:MOXD1 like protein 2 [Habropoda laboriosa]